VRIFPDFILCSAWCFALATAGCRPAPDPEASGLPVTVSILPQKYFVEQIGGDHVRVNVMVPPGATPATYEPKPSQVRALSDAAIYFAAGVPFESAWLRRLTRDKKALRVVDTSEGIVKRTMTAHRHPDHHEEETLDPHTWLSPRLVKTHAIAICDALCEADPDRSETYRTNLAAFHAELETLDGELQAQFEDLTSRTFLVFHPSWGYFAHDYGLEMIPIEVGGQEPSASELGRLVDRSRNESIRVILVQPEFSQRSAEILAREIGVETIPASPLDEAWAANLRRVAGELRRVLSYRESE
jgi:zinc transport system substrate-binding protein